MLYLFKSVLKISITLKEKKITQFCGERPLKIVLGKSNFRLNWL